MYIRLEDQRPEPPTIDTAMSRREGVVLSMFLHAVVLAVLFFGPQLPMVQRWQAEAEQQRQAAAEIEQERQAQERPRFVFVQPRLDMQSEQPKQNAPLADLDRSARTKQQAPAPSNTQPFSQGNSLEFVERAEPKEVAKGRGPAPEPSESTQPAAEQMARATPQPPRPQSQPDPVAPQSQVADGGLAVRESESGTVARGPQGILAPQTARATTPRAAARPPGGALGEALRNLERYVQDESFNNPDGGNSPFGPYVQFDTKGVEFGPWIRRFIAQVKQKWLIPEAAMMLRGHVAITFNVHKDGRITDITVLKPSGIDSFDRAAANALAWVNPADPLPPEYPTPVAFFTVTFFYNEQPPSQ
jgi:TonB family protein